MKKRIQTLCAALCIALLAGCAVTPSTSMDESAPDSEEVISEAVTSSAQTLDSSFLKMYRGQKYPVMSGPRTYTGKENYRVYPYETAPFVNHWPSETVMLINEVLVAGESEEEMQSWCLVLDEDGVSGYVRSTDLKPIDMAEYLKDRPGYGKGIETIGGFKPGDRIEKIIGTLDRDYYLAYENGPIYIFPDSKIIKIEYPIDRPFSGQKTVVAIPDGTSHIMIIRTDSPEFTLKGGYKVGDNANIVLEFYKKKYKLTFINQSDTYDTIQNFYFDMGDGYFMIFHIDTETLSKDSTIETISIMPDGFWFG